MVMTFIEMIREAKGPLPSFTPTHLFKAILIIDKRQVGRKMLAKELKIGEGVVRTLISKMKDMRLVTSDRKGCKLTDYGLKIYDSISSLISLYSELNIDYAKPHNFAVVVKGGAKYVKKGLEERDRAIMGGASGASLFTVIEGQLWMPQLENVSQSYPEIAREIMAKTSPKEGDVIILAWADKPELAEYGALNAALFLLQKMRVS